MSFEFIRAEHNMPDVTRYAVRRDGRMLGYVRQVREHEWLAEIVHRGRSHALPPVFASRRQAALALYAR